MAKGPQIFPLAREEALNEDIAHLLARRNFPVRPRLIIRWTMTDGKHTWGKAICLDEVPRGTRAEDCAFLGYRCLLRNMRRTYDALANPNINKFAISAGIMEAAKPADVHPCTAFENEARNRRHRETFPANL